MGTSATPASEPAEAPEEVIDELSGEELFEIPPDLLDETDTGAPAGQPADAAAAAPPAEGEAPADTPQLPDGYTRDARGVVHRPDGTIAAKSELVATTGQPPEKPPAAAQPPARQAVAGAPAGQPAAEPAVEAPVLEFGFRADSKPVTIPGSKVTDDGVFIPKEYISEVQRLLSHGVVYQGSFRTRLEQAAQKVADTEARVNREVEESKHFLTFFADLLERGPVAVQDWLDDFERNKPQLIADAKIAYAEALTAAKEQGAPAPAKVEGFDEREDDFLANVDRDQMMTQLSTVLATNLREVIVQNGVRGMTSADVNRLHQAISSDPEEMERYFAVATEDIPDMKVVKGDVLVRQAALLKRVQYEAGLITDSRKSISDATAAADANRRAAGGGAPPPTAAVAGAGAGKKKEVPIPTKREELDAFMNADD